LVRILILKCIYKDAIQSNFTESDAKNKDIKIKGGAHSLLRLVTIATGCDNIVLYRPETEICRLNEDVSIRVQTIAQPHSPIPVAIDCHPPTPSIRLIGHSL